MKNQVLTIEQMKHLKKMGVDISYKYFDKIFKDDFIIYELQKWQGKTCEILKVK
jgi:hypothetical protein